MSVTINNLGFMERDQCEVMVSLTTYLSVGEYGIARVLSVTVCRRRARAVTNKTFPYEKVKPATAPNVNC